MDLVYGTLGFLLDFAGKELGIFWDNSLIFTRRGAHHQLLLHTNEQTCNKQQTTNYVDTHKRPYSVTISYSVNCLSSNLSLSDTLFPEDMNSMPSIN